MFIRHALSRSILTNAGKKDSVIVSAPVFNRHGRTDWFTQGYDGRRARMQI